MFQSIKRFISKISNSKLSVPKSLSERILYFFLLGTSHIYNFGNTTRRIYKLQFQTPTKLSIPVISVGNLTWGGNGKTPFVEALIHISLNKNLNPLVLTRGYGEDEQYQIQSHFPNITVISSPNRLELAKIEISQNRKKFDVIVVDDGLQLYELHRDVNFVLINAQNPFGNGYLLPRGSLREFPSTGLQRASCIVLHHSNLVSKTELQALKETIHKYTTAPIIETSVRPLHFFSIKAPSIPIPLTFIKGKKIVAFCGIGFPESFENLLKSLEPSHLQIMSFPDHHPFTKSELETIINGHTNQILFITTEKDYFRMNQLFPSSFMECIYVLAIQLSVPEKEIESILHSIMND